ncbi:hypothetical protein BC936DRAFT_149213, partial [Jimgerdemannia flammicorona]
LFETPGKAHWWEDVLSDDVITRFLDRFVDPSAIRREQEDEAFSLEFTLTVANPAGTGSKGGVMVEQLRVPYRLGKIRVVITDNGIWTLKTTNIRRFKFVNDEPRVIKRRGEIRKVVVDGFRFTAEDVVGKGGWFERLEGVEWKFSTSPIWLATERHPRTYGPAHQIFESHRPLLIVTPPRAEYVHVAQKVAHDWYLYGRGDAVIFRDHDWTLDKLIRQGEYEGNLVLVGGPGENVITRKVLVKRGSSVAFENGSICIGDREYSDPKTGIIFLHPWKSDHLALVIAGLDDDGLRQAARLLPKRTGMMVPDWVITGPEMDWKGVGGILGAGFWNNEWKYDPAIGYLS